MVSGIVISFTWKPYVRGATGFPPMIVKDNPRAWNGMWGIPSKAACMILKILDQVPKGNTSAAHQSIKNWNVFLTTIH